MIFTMRHGQTDWNVARKLQGKTDIPLNDTGRQMAVDARKKLKGIVFDVCYCSPLSRARETAQLVLEGTGVPIIEDERLSEMGFGEYEGIERSFDYPDCPVNVLFLQPELYVADRGAESFEELRARTDSFMEEIAEPLHAMGKNVLIVAHGGTNCSIIGRIRKTALKDYWNNLTGNCDIVQLL